MQAGRPPFVPRLLLGLSINAGTDVGNLVTANVAFIQHAREVFG
jgi:hypothetical protein